jgi:hypothetical protein
MHVATHRIVMHADPGRTYQMSQICNTIRNQLSMGDRALWVAG